MMRKTIICCLVSVLAVGCATNIRKPAAPLLAAKVRFAEFDAVEMEPVEINHKFAGSEANQKAARKINEWLFEKMRVVFPELKDASPGKPEVSTLLIDPYIEEIKFIGGGARFMVGAMAGSSAVLMRVTFTDKLTGEVIAVPEFYQDASGWSGGYGVADNKMLEQIAQDICNYASLNR